MQARWLAVGLMVILTGALSCLGGCASTDAVATGAGVTGGATGAVLTPAVATSASKSAYVLSADEQALECKQLIGRMQIRILEIRDYNERQQTSKASQLLQSGVTGLFGGTSKGIDPNGEYAKDRAILDAYNGQLAAKGCKTFNLDTELQPKNFRETPTPVAPPTAKKQK
jgi:hypothetical protein